MTSQKAKLKKQNRKSKIENVNHPEHYNLHPGGVECIDVVEHMDFCIGNAIKYLWRSGLKPDNSMQQDLRKAIWYIERKLKNS